ncbi:MAG: helix-turn-helix domain-containing protein [Chloroflexota bacterium]
MNIQFYQPAPPLHQFIDCLWYVDLQVPYTREKILPSGTIELMINFGSPHRKYNQTESAYDLMQSSWVAGFQTEFIVNEPVAETCMMGVRFKPGGAYPFLHLPISEITNFVIDLDCIWGAYAHELRERLLEAQSIEQKFAVLEQQLLKRLNHDKLRQPIVQFAINGIYTSNGTLSLKALCQDIGISQKHLITHFKRKVGVSPKQMSRVIRFQKVLNEINPGTPIDWRAIAYACEYYDQSHFNHDFSAFTGMAPSEYVIFRQTLHQAPPEQGADVHFVPIIG